MNKTGDAVRCTHSIAGLFMMVDCLIQRLEPPAECYGLGSLFLRTAGVPPDVPQLAGVSALGQGLREF